MIRIAKTACLLASMLVLSVPGLGMATENESWGWRLPQTEKIAYGGVVSFDGAGMGAGGMMYPAPGLAGFAAAIITHGILVGSMKADQKRKLQEAADLVLAPYQSVLDAFTVQDLMQRALLKAADARNGRLIMVSQPAVERWMVESTPVFTMTQDQTALILHHAIVIQEAGTPPESAYKNIVQIVSLPQNAPDLPAFWLADNGEKLKDESAKLVAESLDVAFAALRGKSIDGQSPQKTFRYLEGGIERMERAHLINERCGRAIVQTLRGNLMSIPLSRRNPEADSAQCDEAASNK